MLFIFDENFSVDFVNGFSIIERANKRSKIKSDIVFSGDFMGTLGSMDEDIIKKASKMDAVIVTHDSDFKRIKHYRALLVQHSVGYIYFRVPRGKYEYWDIVKAFVNKWEDLKISISAAKSPFAFEISKQGQITELSF